MQAFFEGKMFSSESSLRMDFASVMLHLTRRHLPELALGNGHVHAIIRTDNDERERGGEGSNKQDNEHTWEAGRRAGGEQRCSQITRMGA